MTQHLRFSLLILASLIATVCVLWLILAWQSGMFLGDGASVNGRDRTTSAFSQSKSFVRVGKHNVAYIEQGQGEPLLLLHGCPFSAAQWQSVIPKLAEHYRVLAPDWLGLGDTEVTLRDDYRLPQDLELLLGFMDAKNIARANIIAHDHGGAVAQLLMAQQPQRIDRLILTNVEAYDQWPSKPELKYLIAIVNPVTSPLVYAALQFEAVRKRIFRIAVHDSSVLSADLLAEWTTPHTASPARWQRLRRFFAWQLDPEHNRVPLSAVPGMRQFAKPVLLLWGKNDTNFGPELAQRLKSDIPGAQAIQYLEHSAHMPMIEQPHEYLNAALAFLRSAKP